MEGICIRFPHLIEQINKVLDFKTLVKFKGVDRIMCNIIDNQKQGRFFWTRVIQTNLLSNCTEFKEDWNYVLRKIETKYLKKIAINIRNFFTSRPERRQINWSPMHIASAQEDLELCKKIAEVTKDRNPKLKDDWVPLHFAAQIGNIEIYKFLSENLQDMNPGTDIGITPLHLAAKNGHLEMYKLICESVMDKNPVMDGEITPLHLSAKHNQIKVCEFICENVQNVGPTIGTNNIIMPSLTPLTLAINRVNIKVAIVIMNYQQEQIPYYAEKFWEFVILGWVCFLMASGYWLILAKKVLAGFFSLPFGPFAWPYLIYGRWVLLYFRDMYLTNYIHGTFDR